MLANKTDTNIEYILNYIVLFCTTLDKNTFHIGNQIILTKIYWQSCAVITKQVHFFNYDIVLDL